MDDFAPLQPPVPRRGLGVGWVLIAALVAFAIGVALMLYAMRAYPQWLPGAVATPTTATAARAAAAPTPTMQAVAAIDPATLATRETVLAARLASLEARTATLAQDAAAASGQATRAEAMLIAFAARRAIDRGLGLGYLEEQLRLRFGTAQPAATIAVIRAARKPVTLEDLRAGLEAVAPQLTTGEGGWLAGVEREMRSLVIVHAVGTPSPLPADRLARARRMLGTGQVEAALAEVQRMPGAALAGGWGDSARRYVEAHRALDTLEGASILGQAGTETAAAVAPVVPVAPTTDATQR